MFCGDVSYTLVRPYEGSRLRWKPTVPASPAGAFQVALTLSDSSTSPLWLTGNEGGRRGEPGSQEPDPVGRGGPEAGEGDGNGLRGGDPPAGGRDRRVEEPEGGATCGSQQGRSGATPRNT